MAARILPILLLLTSCATARVLPIGTAGPAPAATASDRATCEEVARSEDPSMVFRATVAHGVVGTGLMTLYMATQGALWGAIAGSIRGADGAWIGAAAGAGIGMVLGIAEGIVRAQEAHARFHTAYVRCLGDRSEPSTEGGA